MIFLSLRPRSSLFQSPSMHLMYYEGADGKRQYTLKKVSPKGTLTRSAHPARFSPDDKFSRQRITIKRRYGLLPMQKKTTGSI